MSPATGSEEKEDAATEEEATAAEEEAAAAEEGAGKPAGAEAVTSAAEGE